MSREQLRAQARKKIELNLSNNVKRSRPKKSKKIKSKSKKSCH